MCSYIHKVCSGQQPGKCAAPADDPYGAGAEPGRCAVSLTDAQRQGKASWTLSWESGQTQVKSVFCDVSGRYY